MDISVVPKGLEPSATPESFQALSPKFVFGVDEDGAVVKSSGLSSLASRVLYYLFTTKGSDPLRPQLGGGVTKLVGASDVAGFSTSFARALIEVESALIEEDSQSLSTRPLDSRLKNIKMTGLRIANGDTAIVSILIVAESGKTGLLHLEV